MRRMDAVKGYVAASVSKASCWSTVLERASLLSGRSGLGMCGAKRGSQVRNDEEVYHEFVIVTSGMEVKRGTRSVAAPLPPVSATIAALRYSLASAVNQEAMSTSTNLRPREPQH